MAGVRLKDPGVLQNTRGGRGRSVVIAPRPDGWKVPPLPREVTARLDDPIQARLQPAALRHTREVWKRWWASPPALAVDLGSDYEAISWWIICVFRRSLYIQIVREQPMVRGSTGQPVLNPLRHEIRSATADINRAADRFGMDSLSRFRLHFEAQGDRRGDDPVAAGWDALDPDDDPLAALR